MIAKIIGVNVSVIIAAILLWLLFNYAGIEFAAGCIFGTLIWHVAYMFHTSDGPQ